MSDRAIVTNTFIALAAIASILISLMTLGFGHMEQNAERDTRVRLAKVEACQHATDVSACVNSVD